MAVLIATLDGAGRRSGGLARTAAALAGLSAPPHVKVAHYFVPLDLAGDLERERPSALMVVTSRGNGRDPLRATRVRIGPTTRLEPDGDDPAQLLGVCAVPGRLPERTVLFLLSRHEATPHSDAIDMVTRELARLPLLEMSDRLRSVVSATRRRLLESDNRTPSPALADLVDLMHELAVFEHCGDWAKTFRLRDRLRAHLRSGDIGPELDRLDHLEWSMVWALIEELDRLQP